jgi:hypothetical protein
MHQLSTTAIYHFLSLKGRRCPYHAKVMNMFEMISSDAVFKRTIFAEGKVWRRTGPA